MEQNRLKSPVVWAAVTAQMLAVLMLLGVIGEELGATIKMIAAGVLEILVLFGVLNNPTNQEGF